ncbi:MAG: hypothetical protein P1P88_04875 [Bacteroidales bacterium]|nr:hypothetical protein [Bacteroidales bacterium]
MNSINLKIAIAIIACISIFISNTYSQESLKDLSDEKESKPFQFTFVYPLGTNGTNSPKIANDISLNIFGGFNGGVNAMELGAFVNVNHGDVNGFQGAGFTNVNIGKTTGVQCAGFYNQSYEFNGGQFAGFANLNIKNSSGFMGAGFTNVVRGNMLGWQAAGFSNTTTGSITGAQMAGFANFSKDQVKGAQLAGFANITENIEGVQVAGFVNVANKVKGVQLGFLNIADSVDGVPIGFLSIVRHGYHRFELGASESLFANASIKLGVEHFYNIFTFGFKQVDEDSYWSYGYGVGTLFALSPKVNMNIDAISQQVNENEWNTTKLNLLNTVKLNISYKFTERIEILAGPSFNVMVSEFDFRDGIGSKSTFVPWSFYDKTHDDYTVKMFVGFNAGLRF